MEYVNHKVQLELIHVSFVELKVTPTMMMFKVIDKCTGTAKCLLKHSCAFFLTGSVKENKAFSERLLTNHC
jgi:hypothetical protein